MRIVNKNRLEGILPISRITILLGNYALLYGQTDRDLRNAEDRERARKTYETYFELCRMGAFCHPSPYGGFARQH